MVDMSIASAREGVEAMAIVAAAAARTKSFFMAVLPKPLSWAAGTLSIGEVLATAERRVQWRVLTFAPTFSERICAQSPPTAKTVPREGGTALPSRRMALRATRY